MGEEQHPGRMHGLRVAHVVAEWIVWAKHQVTAVLVVELVTGSVGHCVQGLEQVHILESLEDLSLKKGYNSL